MYPQFLIIGAQKAGTTWLYQNLRSHPQIWLPPEKEIHYFDFPPLIPFYFLLFAPDRSIRHWGLNRMNRDYRKVRAGEQSIAWYIRYYFYLRTRRWYSSLFTPEAGQISGEITPRYAVLQAQKLAGIHALLPDIKIIYLLRNPIDRIWSDLAMYHRPNFGCDGLHTAGEQQILKFLSNSQHLASSRYIENLQRWERYYPASRIFVGFQPQISEAPEQLLRAVFRFLEVDDSEAHILDIAAKRINSHSYPDIPGPMSRMLARLLIDDLEKLHGRFENSYTGQWLASAQGSLDR